MSSVFEVREHVFDAQHIREYARATAHSQEEVLKVAVKQYIPRDNLNPKPGDITVIASHANGFVKELYEPLWEDLVTEGRKQGLRFRGFWIADVAWQGQSGILNESKLGNDPSWMDHARDLLHMTNVFRSEMPRPLIGAGHSFGGCIVTNVALMHPRLFTALVMIDPVISKFNTPGPVYGFLSMRPSAFRRDLWPSRDAAAEGIRRNKFYATWDRRAVDALVRHGFRDTPTALYPDEKGKATLATTKHHEVFTYYRPTLQGLSADGKRVLDASKLADVNPAELAAYPDYPFYRPETALTTEKLPNLRPPVIWLVGGKSNVCGPEQRKEKMDLTGIGIGGSGGVKSGKVKMVVFEEYGHLVAMEIPSKLAQHAASFIAPEIERWREEQQEYERWARKDDRSKQTLDDDWIAMINSVKVPGAPAPKPKI
ncbi:putative toxin biosynthesis protein [Phaeoacremonium minimum UCRPA7]|uniref:Putative toxin biosynthesis protein n=1 Tax=Phaeoacremonium minimum (strain UCR-PA7) TaxID=1286976 RepID=R8BKM8_PHAM7|nr:putative toxin biosynthesis protein [Phaeoacremonium minimum UCRPA7]EON99861.1 putative toxin biosynthesis protein [Phaeoacremonium minimum UCRPA7]